MSDILKVCDKIDAAGEEAEATEGLILDWRAADFTGDGWQPFNAAYLALAANHAQDLATVVRRLVEVAIRYKDIAGDMSVSLRALERDYPGLLASPPEAGRLEGGEEPCEK